MCMLLHAFDDTERGETSLSIHSPDTDVMVLALERLQAYGWHTVTSTSQFHCVLYMTHKEINLWHSPDSMHSLEVIKWLPYYVESPKSHAGIL